MKRITLLVALCGIVCMAVSAVALGSSRAHARAATDNLTVAIGAVDPVYAQLYVAQQKGFFAAQNINVTITAPGSSLLASVVSGAADLGAIGTGTPLVAAANGADTSIIYDNAAATSSGWVAAANPAITNLRQCKRVGSLGIGSGLYANAVRYRKAAGATYDVVPFGDVPTMEASLQSGNIDCAMGTFGYFSAVVAAGKAHFVVDPTKPSTVPSSAKTQIVIPGGVLFGVASNLSQKRSVIVRFLRAYQKALSWVKSGTASVVAGLLKQSPDFATETQDQIAQQIQEYRFVYAPKSTPKQAPGYLPKGIWPNTIAFFVNGGLSTINPTNPIFSYAARVDMSYYNAAVAKKKK